MRGGDGTSGKRFEIWSRKPADAFLLMPLTILAFTVLFTTITVPQDSYAQSSLSETFSDPGPHNIIFRDVASGSPTADPIITLDKSTYLVGQSGTITISDFNGNIDLLTEDTISATVNGVDMELTETGPNNGIFSGQFVAAFGGNTVSYEPDPPDSVRAFVKVTTTVADQIVTVKDFLMSQGSTCLGGDAIVTEGVSVSSDGPFTVDYISISYANAVLADFSTDPLLLRVYHTGFALTTPTDLVTDVFGVASTEVTHEFDTDENGDGVMTAVTASDVIVADSLLTGTPSFGGTYVLVLAGLGCGGGVGGGITAGGVVFNFLGGTFLFGGGGLDRVPPSLTRPISSGVQFDPFTPIEPTGSFADTTAQPPLRIGQNGYNLYGYSNTIVTNTIETGQFTDMSLAFEESSKVEHVAVYFVDQDRDEYSDTDPALIIDNGNMVKVDPQGIFGDDIQLSTSKQGTKSIFNFGVSFDKPANKHVIIVAWDDKRNAGTTKVFNALKIVGNAIPDQVAHFMPIEALGEFDLIKDDNGQYVLLHPAQTETITISPQSITYPEFVGRMERHDTASLYDVIQHEQKRAADITSKMNVDNNLFSTKEDTKPFDSSKRAPQLSSCGKYLGCELDRENTDLMKTLMWQEHLKAEKILKAYLEQRHHVE